MWTRKALIRILWTFVPDGVNASGGAERSAAFTATIPTGHHALDLGYQCSQLLTVHFERDYLFGIIALFVCLCDEILIVSVVAAGTCDYAPCLCISLCYFWYLLRVHTA